MFVDYLYNAACQAATVKESRDGQTIVELENIKKRFSTWNGAIKWLLMRGYQFAI